MNDLDETLEWFNDATHTCATCGFIFRVYGLDLPTVNFCTSCGSSQLDK